MFYQFKKELNRGYRNLIFDIIFRERYINILTTEKASIFVKRRILTINVINEIEEEFVKSHLIFTIIILFWIFSASKQSH